MASSISPLKEFWDNLSNDFSRSTSESIHSSSSFLSSSIESSPNSIEASAASVNWMIINRGGLAQIAGLIMVPSQFLGDDISTSNEIVDNAIERSKLYGYIIERFTCPEGNEIEGIICYPKNWDRSNKSMCIFYSNPNGITIPGYFNDDKLSYTPADLLELYQCPIILYDYRGTGLSQKATSLSSLKFRPTYDSIVKDGLSVMKYAFYRFENIDVWGSSLGGGVSTIALNSYLKANPKDSNRVKLFNHDSFSTTPRVVFPNTPKIANFVGLILGGMLDAQTSMKSLIEQGIDITVLYHDQDPVIPKGARMSEFVDSLPAHANVSTIYSPEYGHANLSYDMKRVL